MTTAGHGSDDAARRLARLAAWRWGAVASALVAGGLTLAGALAPAAAGTGLAVAVVLAAGAEVARRVLLEAWMLRDDLVAVPEVARARERLRPPPHPRGLGRAPRPPPRT